MVACTSSEDSKGNAIKLAKVGDYTLYIEDINPALFSGLSPQDSVSKLKQFTQQWIDERIFLEEAETILSDDEKEISQRIEAYRQNILVYELEKKWASTFADTIILEEEINNYYEKNKENFLLKKNIVQIRYLKVDKDLPKKELDKAIGYIQNPNPKNDSLLRIFAEAKADNYYLENNWLLFEDVIREIPISQSYSQERYLRSNRYVKLQENEFLYLVYFVDFKVRDEISPMEFELDNIKQYIRLQRQEKWLSEKRNKLVQEARKNNKIKIWLK